MLLHPPLSSCLKYVHLLASTLGVSARMISQYRQWAIRAGILREIQPHNRTEKRATRFVFNLHRFGPDGRERSGPGS